nr:protein SIEVE ELEMENT OCCLUSION B-like [Ipomoea batatas]
MILIAKTLKPIPIASFILSCCDEESEEETSKDEKSNEDESYNEESNEDGSYNEESNEDESYDEESNVELHLLENKSLLLLISSSLDIDDYLWEILIRLRWTTELHVFWIPILDCPALGDAKIMKKQYRDLADRGSLVIARNLKKVVTPRFIRFVKEKFFPEFQIGGEPIIVSLDHHGRIVHRNALHMILMRAIDLFERISTIVSKGDSRIPLLMNMLMEKTSALRDFVPDIDERISEFADKTNKKINAWLRRIEKKVKNPIYNNIYTRERENDLWKEKEVSWCTKLMASWQGNAINKWVVSQSQFNSKWKIKMAYIGSNMEVASVINRDEICMAPDDELSIPFFWARLRSIFLSRIRFLNESHCDEGRDEIVEGLKKLLAYEDKGLVSPVDGWAMLCKGNKIVVCDLGDNMLTVMNEFEKWKESAIAKGFDRAFKAHHEKKLAGTTTYASQCHPCCALDYPSNFDEVPKNVKCPQYLVLKEEIPQRDTEGEKSQPYSVKLHQVFQSAMEEIEAIKEELLKIKAEGRKTGRDVLQRLEVLKLCDACVGKECELPEDDKFCQLIALEIDRTELNDWKATAEEIKKEQLEYMNNNVDVVVTEEHDY